MALDASRNYTLTVRLNDVDRNTAETIGNVARAACEKLGLTICIELRQGSPSSLVTQADIDRGHELAREHGWT